MTAAATRDLSARFGERLLLNEPLSRYTTYKIGGPAVAMLFPQSSKDAADAIEICLQTGIPWVVIGLGSNVLIPDDGYPGLVVRMGKGIDGILDRSEDNRIWRVAAGMPTPRLARQTAKFGLAGVHKLVGIPGTVGGGVAMNAGSSGQNFGKVVQSVEVVTSEGTLSEVSADDIDWRYRGGLADSVVTKVTIQLEPAESDGLLDDVRECLAVRQERTPFDLPCCGSVFKNPAGSGQEVAQADEAETAMTAGQLIDAAGCKGFRVGSAEVSKLHANYIVNLGGATADEVHSVIDAVRGRVFGEFGVELELEVRIID